MLKDYSLIMAHILLAHNAHLFEITVSEPEPEAPPPPSEPVPEKNIAYKEEGKAVTFVNDNP